MPPRHAHRNLDGSPTVLGKIGYVSKSTAAAHHSLIFWQQLPSLAA